MAVVSTSAGVGLIERSKAIRIRTEGGKKITVQGFNDDVRTSDGFVAIPCDAMRNDIFNRIEYFVLAADQTPDPDDPPKSSQVLLVPCDDNTIIKVEPTQLVTMPGLLDLAVRPVFTQFGPGGSPTSASFTINAEQTVLIEHPDDLSGTIIRSNRPLVVLSGHECGEIPIGVTACDHMVEQMPPGMSFGMTFFLVPLAGRYSGDMFRVGTLTDGTQVTVTCVTSSDVTPTRLSLEGDGAIDRGEYITFMTPDNLANDFDWKPSYCCLDATEPVIVAQYSTGYSYDKIVNLKSSLYNRENGDPFMTLIPPVTQFLNNYTMKALDGAPGPFSFRFINLALSSAFFDNSVSAQSQVQIDGSAVNPVDGWIPFYCSNNEICGYGAQAVVNGGTINVYHENEEVGLGMSYYAYQQQNSYGMPSGFELTPLAGIYMCMEMGDLIRLYVYTSYACIRK